MSRSRRRLPRRHVRRDSFCYNGRRDQGIRMIAFSAHQLTLLEQVVRQRFMVRLADHLADLHAQPRDALHESLARRAMEIAELRGLIYEADIAALAEMLLAFRPGGMTPPATAWIREIVEDCRPDKARRLRECLAIERRLAQVGG